jgi:hypothetical protein
MIQTSKKTSVRQLEEAATGDGWHLISGTVAGGVGLPHAFQDGAHCPQYVIGHTRIPGDPRDGRHAKVH